MTLTSEQARQLLPQEQEEWLSFACLAGHSGFLDYGLRELLRLRTFCVSYEVAYWVIRSCLTRRDRETARMLLNDWAESASKPQASVTKWVPGEHYHVPVLGEKFMTLAAAQAALERRGYRYGGLQERFVYHEQE